MQRDYQMRATVAMYARVTDDNGKSHDIEESEQIILRATRRKEPDRLGLARSIAFRRFRRRHPVGLARDHAAAVVLIEPIPLPHPEDYPEPRESDTGRWFAALGDTRAE